MIGNSRHDNHRSAMWRFSVKRRSDLVGVVVPFFENHPLVTAKAINFRRFSRVLQLMQQGEHLGEVGLRRIAALTEQLNRRARSRYLESSEAIRQPCRSDTDMKIWS